MGNHSAFPGRWLGGSCLILAPLLLVTAVLLRLPFFLVFPSAELARLQADSTFFPLELAAFERQSSLLVTSYGAFLAGNILLWPAVATLVELIGARRPQWAFWGGALTISGLFARTFHAGVDHFAFQLTRVQNLDLATKAVADSYPAISYGPFDLVGVLGFAVLVGWVLLAIGAYRSGLLGLVRSAALGSMALLMQGVLKGATAGSVLWTAALCVALAPLGVQVLRGHLRPPEPDEEMPTASPPVAV